MYSVIFNKIFFKYLHLL